MDGIKFKSSSGTKVDTILSHKRINFQIVNTEPSLLKYLNKFTQAAVTQTIVKHL